MYTLEFMVGVCDSRKAKLLSIYIGEEDPQQAPRAGSGCSVGVAVSSEGKASTGGPEKDGNMDVDVPMQDVAQEPGVATEGTRYKLPEVLNLQS